MTNSRNLIWCYTLLAVMFLAAGGYYIIMVRPLVVQERDLDDRTNQLIASLTAGGNGMTADEVTQSVKMIEEDIAAFSEIGKERAQTIQLSPDIREHLNSPFQMISFEDKRFLVAMEIRTRAAEKKVALFDGWEGKLPTYKSSVERPSLLWVKLGVIEQLLGAAIAAGVDRVDGFNLEPRKVPEEGEVRPVDPSEVPVQMQITGSMESIHDIIMALPLRGTELESLNLDWEKGPKSSFFLNRFILRKSSRENVDEVSLDFVASGYFDTALSP